MPLVNMYNLFAGVHTTLRQSQQPEMACPEPGEESKCLLIKSVLRALSLSFRFVS